MREGRVAHHGLARRVLILFLVALVRLSSDRPRHSARSDQHRPYEWRPYAVRGVVCGKLMHGIYDQRAGRRVRGVADIAHDASRVHVAPAWRSIDMVHEQLFYGRKCLLKS